MSPQPAQRITRARMPNRRIWILPAAPRWPFAPNVATARLRRCLPFGLVQEGTFDHPHPAPIVVVGDDSHPVEVVRVGDARPRELAIVDRRHLPADFVSRIRSRSRQSWTARPTVAPFTPASGGMVL